MNISWRNVVAGLTAGVAFGYGLYHVLFKDSDPKETDSAGDLSDYCGVFVVRKDLKMRQGKIAAQCGHASLGIFQKIVKRQPLLAEQWLNSEFPKVFYYCANEGVMDTVEEQADAAGYSTIIIHDAGRTQIAAGSATVLAIAPVRKGDVAKLIEGHDLVLIP